MYRDDDANFYRRLRKEKLSQLDNWGNYDTDKFILDLEKYFDNEVDFDLTKIRKEVEQKDKLNQLIAKAKRNNTHPVAEFLQELFTELYKNSD